MAEASVRLTRHPDDPDVLLSDVFVAPAASLLDVANALRDIAAELERRAVADV